MWSTAIDTFLYACKFVLEYFLERSLDRMTRQISKQRTMHSLQPRSHNSMPDIYGVVALKALIEENDLRRRDLSDIFETRANCSEVLAGRQPLTIQNVQKICDRFHISPLVFFPR
ncbi:hypothetical protein S7335_908 [Synechococcus sp. PCC 7335]|nr:hypothetical protein S7335_908 [Synechococcus sp. PCC 7335]